MSSGSEETEESDSSWIAWYCGLKGNEFLCEVDKAYIEDGFNLYGLRAMVPNYNESLKVILDVDPQYGCDGDVLSTAALLYGLIHARYILTAQGLNAMHEKYMLEDFGKCTRHLCNCQRVLPMGLNSEPQQDVAKVFCPKCGEVYSLPTLLDGAYFGPTFPHLFLMTFPDEMPKDRNLRYVPKVFGFKVHQSSQSAALAAVSSRRRNGGTASQRITTVLPRSTLPQQPRTFSSISNNTSQTNNSASTTTASSSSSRQTNSAVVVPDKSNERDGGSDNEGLSKRMRPTGP